VSARRPPRTSERASATGSAETTASTRDSGSARGSSDRCSAGRDTRPPLRTRLDRLTPSRHYRGRGSWRRTPIEHGRAIRASCSSTGHCRITRRASQRVQPYEVHDGQRTDPMCRRLAARTRGAHGPAALASRRDDDAHDALAHGIHGVTGGRAAHALATAPRRRLATVAPGPRSPDRYCDVPTLAVRLVHVDLRWSKASRFRCSSR
jgi:hypothetical protein